MVRAEAAPKSSANTQCLLEIYILKVQEFQSKKAPASVLSDKLNISVVAVFISGVHYKVGTAVFGQITTISHKTSMLGLQIVLKFWLPWIYEHLCMELSLLWFSAGDMHAHIGEISYAQPRGDSFFFIFLPGRSLHCPHSLLDFPCWHTKANKKALWAIQHDEVAAVASDLRGDLWSPIPGEDAAEQSHPCWHSTFQPLCRVSPSPCSTSPSQAHKGCIHQGPANGYNPFERQQALPAPPGLGLKCSSSLGYSSPGPPWLALMHMEGFEGLRTHWGGSVGWREGSLGQQVLLKWLHLVWELTDLCPRSCLVSCPHSSHGQAAAQPCCSGWGEPSLLFQPQFIHGWFALICSRASTGR